MSGINMARVRAKDIKKITFSIKIETDDPDFEPIKAGLKIEIADEMTLSKDKFMETVKQTGQTFVDLFNKEVEE